MRTTGNDAEEEISFVTVARIGEERAVGEVPGVTVARAVCVPAHPVKRRETMIATMRRNMLKG
jgi:hypothetical protein